MFKRIKERKKEKDIKNKAKITIEKTMPVEELIEKVIVPSEEEPVVTEPVVTEPVIEIVVNKPEDIKKAIADVKQKYYAKGRNGSIGKPKVHARGRNK